MNELSDNNVHVIHIHEWVQISTRASGNESNEISEVVIETK